MANSSDTVVAVDVGGTTTKGAVVDRRGGHVLERRRDTPREQGADAVVAFILDFADELRGQARQQTAGAPRAVGVAVPGLVDESAGVARYSANLGWRDVPLGRLLQERLAEPVAVCHDVRAGAEAERVIGAAHGSDDFLFLTLGTGIGSALVIEGRTYAGPHGRGGELGHAPVWPGGAICGCGRQGCLEAYASASSVSARYRLMTGTALDVDRIVVRAGYDEVAALVWRQAVEALALGIAAYVALTDTELVVVGGGMAGAGDALFRPLRDRLAAEVRFREPPEVCPASLGETAGRVGAAINAWYAAGLAPDTLGWEVRP